MAFVEIYVRDIVKTEYTGGFGGGSKKLQFVADKLPPENTYICSFSIPRNPDALACFEANEDKLNILYKEKSINFMHPESSEGDKFQNDHGHPLRCVNYVFEVKDNG